MTMWKFFLLFILDVILLAHDFYVCKIVGACFDGFFMGMLFMTALDWWYNREE